MGRSARAQWSARERLSGSAPRVIIVGAGLGGLSTGCYGQMSGMETRIFEKHVLPGGCCTSWSRDGYIFDYCIEWLTGTAPGNNANQIWRELGALNGKTVQNFDMFNTVAGEDGRSVAFYNDPDRLERHLLRLSPVDAPVIRSFCRDLRRFADVNLEPSLKPAPLQTAEERTAALRKTLPVQELLQRTVGTSMASFAARFQDPLLRRALPFIFYQDHDFPLLPFLLHMAGARRSNAGFPQGGSLGLARSIEERYTALGGRIDYRARVERILIEDDRAVGVELRNGERHYADHIVSACDGAATMERLLDGRYSSPKVKELFKLVLDTSEVVHPGVVSVFVGYKGDVEPDVPHSTTHLLSEADSARLPGVMQNSLVVQLRSRYSGEVAPAGKSVIYCNYFSDYASWKTLRRTDRRKYWERKREVGEFVREFLERCHPGIADRIEVVDVATPVTTERYTGNLHGSIIAWKSFTDADSLLQGLINEDRLRLPGLDGFSLAGQWFTGGSLIRVAVGGRFVTQYICEELGLEFRAWESTDGEAWHPGKLGPLPQLDKSMT
ncbi:phytoene desaturase family protein [Streptomyces scopuliridis]|uniref:FAD-dependent oxidoreductase n=1 Tax=Streptomyces scopuliridis RB72 TaxID=1440053 RepID=A0A2T7TGD6_9ACTN|nr:NAD(P)/FAD-dependent oxidoreductase [Streptomyces scopuliridis]PVE14209.1 FAD-dependent oxidoreductase [Streptomyces scopuliridis RB72]